MPAISERSEHASTRRREAPEGRHDLQMFSKTTKEVITMHIENKDIPKNEYQKIQNYINILLSISKDTTDLNNVVLTYHDDIFSVVCSNEDLVDPLLDESANRLLKSSNECTVISLHNKISLSLADLRLFILCSNIKLLITIANKDNILCLTRNKDFNQDNALDLLKHAINLNNNAKSVKDRKYVIEYFIQNCNNTGIRSSIWR